MYCLVNHSDCTEKYYISYDVDTLQEIVLSLYEEFAYGWYNEFIQNPNSYSECKDNEIKRAYEFAYDETLDWDIHEGILIV